MVTNIRTYIDVHVHSMCIETYLVPSPVLVLQYSDKEDLLQIAPILQGERRGCGRGNAMGAEPCRKSRNLPGNGEMK